MTYIHTALYHLLGGTLCSVTGLRGRKSSLSGRGLHFRLICLKNWCVKRRAAGSLEETQSEKNKQEIGHWRIIRNSYLLLM